ncbi:ATP-binding protein [Prosthecobacter sp.]|uniref:sensor histidine kinase n=1 Tax=Prosthecobacter sp. TaxID=1965333 RepID=UPI002AB8E88A|nr:ATP-binding protein [Prosthecobacter sp.]MDZ4402708.1 ATP-binding protein [Prosthecobacter sp.]
MTTLCLVLTLLLAACLITWMQREKHWLRRWEGVAKSIGMRARDANQLPEQAGALYHARQQAEQQAEQRRVFETLLGEISQGIALVDEHLHIRYANQPLKKLLNRQEIRPGRALIEEVRDHQIASLVQEAMLEKRHTVRRIQMLPSSVGAGTDLGGRHFLIESAPLPTTSGGGAWLMIQDITESAMTEQIRQDFVANASHELRTPLTIINGYIEMMQDGGTPNPASMKKCLDVMEKHGKRIARIIEDMLAISRLEDSSTPLNCEPFSVRACVQDAADHLAPMMEGRNVRLEFDFPKDGGKLQGDRFYWDQVFTNLIENSVKENNRPGLVIRVSGEWQQDHCILKVSDNGIGIPAHDLPFVFKRFYRGNKHHSSEIKGTGLGLSIVKRAVEAHGGTIELTSTPGVETSFTMRVPLQHTKA